MKRALAFLFVLVMAVPLRADSTTALNAVSGITSSTPLASAQFKRCYAQVYSASGATATIRIEGSSDVGFTHVQILGTITDPSSNGEYWGGACPAFLRLNVTGYASGTITGIIERREPTP